MPYEKQRGLSQVSHQVAVIMHTGECESSACVAHGRVLIRRWDPGTSTRIHKSQYLPTFK